MLTETLAALRSGIDAGHHRGAVVAGWLGGESFEVAAGEAGPGRPVDAGHLHPWFSCTKVLTAVAVMQKIEAGALALEDRVVDHLPAFGQGGKERVQVKHLLTHTAGFRGEADRLPTGADVSPTELLELICATPMEKGWTPGERAAYQPRGCFTTLAAVLAEVDGRTYPEIVSEDVIEMLGLHDTWVELPAGQHRRYGPRIGVIEDTSVEGHPQRPELTAPDVAADGSTGAIGSTWDLARLARALLEGGTLDGGRVLSGATVEAVTQRHRQGLMDETFGAVIDWGWGVMVNSRHYTGAPAPYGYGELAGRDAFGHGGARSSVMFADPEHGLAAAFVANGLAREPVHHKRTQPVLSALYRDLGLG